jgi:HlyD family secretion protein
MRSLLKWLIILAFIGGGLATAGYFGQRYLKSKGVAKYTTATVSTGRIETVVNSTGPIKPVQSVSVGSFVSGPIAEIKVDFNDKVKKDQLLGLIDPRLLQSAWDREKAALDTQNADLARINAQLDQARRNEDRADKLRKTNKDYISDQEMDNLHFSRVALEAQRDLSKANIKAAEAGLENAKTNLGYTKIKSPVDGIVIDRKVDPGQTVAAGFTTPEMFIVGMEMDLHLFVFASVDEADVVQILTAQKQGRPVKFTVDSCPEDVFTGKIYQVRQNATTTQNVVTYPVVIEVPKPNLEKLRVGSTANVSFQIDVRDNVTRIPTAALRFVPPDNLIRPEDKQYVELKVKKDPKEGEEKLSAERRAEQVKARNKRVVWVQEGEKLVAVPVTIGLQDGQYAELVSGDLKEGQVLVTGLEGEDPRARR